MTTVKLDPTEQRVADLVAEILVCAEYMTRGQILTVTSLAWSLVEGCEQRLRLAPIYCKGLLETSALDHLAKDRKVAEEERRVAGERGRKRVKGKAKKQQEEWDAVIGEGVNHV